MIVFLLILVFSSILYLFIDFLLLTIRGRRIFKQRISQWIDVGIYLTLLGYYFLSIDSFENSCCGESTAFAPEHQLTIYVFLSVLVFAFLISRVTKSILPPLVQCVLMSLNLFGFVFNFIVAFQLTDYWLFGNVSIGLIYLLEMKRVNTIVFEQWEKPKQDSFPVWQRFFVEILKMKFMIKTPVLSLVGAPFIVIIILVLTLFGQQPDSIILAFTQTYKHGFSELDYLCKNVECGGHFLCSVAAGGHKHVVKPLRYGERAQTRIICNRQLLVSNAFEEIIEERFPKMHGTIRTRYNRVGNMVHKYYGLFNNKLVADLIYLLMKPLELGFLIVLYSLDHKPENRIARQYVSMEIVQELKKQQGNLS